MLCTFLLLFPVHNTSTLVQMLISTSTTCLELKGKETCAPSSYWWHFVPNLHMVEKAKMEPCHPPQLPPIMGQNSPARTSRASSLKVTRASTTLCLPHPAQLQHTIYWRPLRDPGGTSREYIFPLILLEWIIFQTEQCGSVLWLHWKADRKVNSPARKFQHSNRRAPKTGSNLSYHLVYVLP